MIYIGPESQTLTNFMIHFKDCQFYSVDPSKSSARKETLNVNKTLMRRYYMVQKAKDARTVGILAGTLGVANYLEVIAGIKELCTRATKKTYTFIMGKLNPAKLANFPEIDVFVIIACPENSLIDSKEFYRPVVTPFEIELACVRGAEWTGEYELDFSHLLPRLAEEIAKPAPDPSEAAEADDFSFISGTFRQQEGAASNSKDALAIRNQTTDIALLPSAKYLANRTFSGLERKLGETEVIKAVVGRAGIASSYNEEAGNSTSGATKEEPAPAAPTATQSVAEAKPSDPQRWAEEPANMPKDVPEAYRTYSDDGSFGKDAPSLDTLEYIKDSAVTYSTEKPTVVVFFAKFAKGDYTTVVGVSDIADDFKEQAQFLGIAVDPVIEDAQGLSHTSSQFCVGFA